MHYIVIKPFATIDRCSNKQHIATVTAILVETCTITISLVATAWDRRNILHHRKKFEAVISHIGNKQWEGDRETNGRHKELEMFEAAGGKDQKYQTIA